MVSARFVRRLGVCRSPAGRERGKDSARRRRAAVAPLQVQQVDFSPGGASSALLASRAGTSTNTWFVDSLGGRVRREAMAFAMNEAALIPVEREALESLFRENFERSELARPYYGIGSFVSFETGKVPD